MKIILSRKGFDSAAGGHPSPYFVDNGRLISFPIPEGKSGSIDTGRTYADLRFDENLSYLDIMKQLGLKDFENMYTHVDPDISYTVLDKRHEDWKGLFGQCSSAQAHLKNKEIRSGDLFLFFGWFRDVIRTYNGYKYVSGTDKHIIWGYLQVDEIQEIDCAEEYELWKSEHPHYKYRNREHNTAYIARDNLSFAPHLPGSGTFSYKSDLVLTSPGQKKRSVWRLPQYFHPNFGTSVSYHENINNKSGNPIWMLNDDYCILNSVGRGQEFVIEGNDNIVRWAMKLFENI